MQFEVNWSIGGRDVIEAKDETAARETMIERLPKDEYDWYEIEIGKAAK